MIITSIQTKRLKGQAGTSLIEQAVTLFVISLGLLTWLNVYKVSTFGTVLSKNNLRAQNLVISKMEDIKSMSINQSLAGSWDSVTQNALVSSYSDTTVTRVARIDNKSFTWVVSVAWVDITATAANAAPVLSSLDYATKTSETLRLVGQVYWKDVDGPRSLSLTTYVSDLRT